MKVDGVQSIWTRTDDINDNDEGAQQRSHTPAQSPSFEPRVVKFTPAENQRVVSQPGIIDRPGFSQASPRVQNALIGLARKYAKDSNFIDALGEMARDLRFRIKYSEKEQLALLKSLEQIPNGLNYDKLSNYEKFDRYTKFVYLQSMPYLGSFNSDGSFVSNLGPKVDNIIKLSPYLQKQLANFSKGAARDGWQIVYAPLAEAGFDAITDYQAKTITIDPQQMDDAASFVTALGHQIQEVKSGELLPETSARDAQINRDDYINLACHHEFMSMMADERIREQVLENASPELKKDILQDDSTQKMQAFYQAHAAQSNDDDFEKLQLSEAMFDEFKKTGLLDTYINIYGQRYDEYVRQQKDDTHHP